MSKLQEGIKQAFIDYDVPAIVDHSHSKEETDILKMVVEYVPTLIEQLEQAQEDRKELIERCAGYKEIMDMQDDWLNQSGENNKKLIGVLEWYADDKQYRVNVSDQWGPATPVLDDGGQRARTLLKELCEVKGNG